MAALSDTDRQSCYSAFIQEIGALREPFNGVTKAQLRAAVDALDDFLVTNATAINSAIPAAARSSLTVAQKARLLRWVVYYRFIKGA